GVVVLLAALVLLRAAVVIDAEQQPAARLDACAEVHRRLAAVAADLDHRAQVRVRAAELVQAEALVVVEEALAGEGDAMCVRVHGRGLSGRRRARQAQSEPGSISSSTTVA